MEEFGVFSGGRVKAKPTGGATAKSTGGTTAKPPKIFDDERKRACGLSALGRNCTVFSIGSNGQWSFEAGIVERTQCRVHVFDCTVDEQVRVPVELSHRVTLHRVCIGSAPPPGRRKVLTVPRRADGSPGAWSSRRWVGLDSKAVELFRSYEELLALAGLVQPPELLKVRAPSDPWVTPCPSL